jgi:hypothetical protein
MTILGIDPGAHGVIAVLNESSDLLELVDMAALLEANGRTATNAPLLAGILARTECPHSHRGVRRRSRPADRVLDTSNMETARDIPPGAENKDLALTRAIARWPARLISSPANATSTAPKRA